MRGSEARPPWFSSHLWLAAQQQITSDQQGSIVVYPYVATDGSQGQDTQLRLVNRSEALMDATCAYTDYTGKCSTSGQRCVANSNCSGTGEFCQPASSVTSFTVSLTAQQPLVWRASAGLNGTIRIPSLPDLFSGTLRCVATDGKGVPLPSNALAGGATLVRRPLSPTPGYDAAEYQTFNIPGLENTGNGDGTLVLGGPNAEYAGCPNALSFDVFFDGGIEPATKLTSTWTSLLLTRCSADLRPGVQDLTGSVIYISASNEYGNRFIVNVPFLPGPMGPRPISSLDVHNPTSSIFHAGNAGTLTGHMKLVPGSSRFLGLAIEEHRDLNDPQQRWSAFLSPSLEGEPFGTDAIALQGAVPTPTPMQTQNFTQTPTPTPASVGPEITFFGLATADNQRLTPSSTDADGDPVYVRLPGTGLGFIIVVEARGGLSGKTPGTAPVTPNPTDPTVRPFLQIQADRDLGEGSPEICDAGGVPAVNPPSYDSASQSITNALHDFACRFDSVSGCIRGPDVKTSNVTVPYGFVSPLSTACFCTPPFGAELKFPPGDTALVVQWRDTAGNIGNRQRIVVRVQNTGP